MGQRRRGAGIGWACVALALTGCDVALLRGLSRQQARDLSAELDRSGVVARVVPEPGGAMRLDVNETSVADAVATLTRSEAAARCEPQAAAAPASRWLETPGEERDRHTALLSRTLETSLEHLPGVVDARVHLSLPAGMRSVPEAQTRPAASVLLLFGVAGQPQATAARELVAGAVPGLAPSAVRVVETHRAPPAPGPEFARIGPIVVTQQSFGTLKAWLAGSLVVHMLLAAAVLRPLLRKLRRRV